MTGYAFHPEALRELDEIREYIATENPDAANRMVDEIVDAIGALVNFPRQGKRRTDLTSRPLRFIWVRDYLVAYTPDIRPLYVVAVTHGRRSPRVIAALLRSRD